MAAKKAPPTYGELQDQLDAVLAKLEDPKLDIDKAMTMYEQGLKLIKQLDERLAETENRVSKAQADFAAEAGQ